MSTITNNSYNDIYLKYVPVLNINEMKEEPTEIIDNSANNIVVDNKIVSTIHNDQLIVFKVENLNTDFDGQVLTVIDDSESNHIDNIILPATDSENYDCFIPISTECQFNDSDEITASILDKTNQTPHYAVIPDGGNACTFDILEDVSIEKPAVPLDSTSTTKVKIAGKNLATGQTILINNVTSKPAPVEEKLTKRSNGVISRVNGKRIIGKILEIKPPKLIEPIVEITEENPVEAASRNDYHEENLTCTMTDGSELEFGDNNGYLLIEDKALHSRLVKKKSHEVESYLINAKEMDELTLKTLVGVMDMKSFSKYLIDRTLMIKNVCKMYNSMSQTSSIKEINYFKGKLQKSYTYDDNSTEIECWQFVPVEMIANVNQTQIQSNTVDNIDLSVDYNDMQQVDIIKEDDQLQLSEDVEMITTSQSSQLDVDGDGFVDDFVVNLNIIVTEDENGVKRTKVVPKILENGFICSICNKLCATINHLRRHMKMAHRSNPPKIYTCDLCKKTFLTASTLTRHRRIHNGDKNFQCSICMKAFNTVGSLKRHFTVHAPALRRLQCTVCMQRFTDGSSLKKHLLIHTGLKPFECNVCFKRFVHLGDLNFHRRIHDPTKQLATQFVCELCGKEFNRHSNLVRHVEIHRDNKGTVNKCDICGSSYNFISSLTRHIVKNHMKET